MLDFLQPKTKILLHNFKEIPQETLEIMGIAQINPYYSGRSENEEFISVVCFANESKKYDEREGMVLSEYFTLRKCPRCKKIELVPVRLKINFDSVYLRHEEEIAYDAYEEHPKRRHFPTVIQAYCNSCNTCFEIRVKNKDLWIKEAKKIKEKNLIGNSWIEYQVD